MKLIEGLGCFFIGWLAGEKLKDIYKSQPKIKLYCADIKLTELDTGVLQADPCMNRATIIYGGKSLCDDCLDVMLCEMTGSLEE